MSSSVSVVGRELIAQWAAVERGTAAWVLKLAAFDASGEWAEDGFHSCVSWLVDRCEVAYATAKEKLRVAHELQRRPVVRAAFEDGLAYSKVRWLIRLEGLDDERDRVFVDHARTESVRMVEARVKNFNYYATQDKAPADIDDHYGLRRERGFGGGFGRLVIEAPDDMLDRLLGLVEAYGNFLHHRGGEDGQPTLRLDEVEPVDKDALQPYPQARPRSARRLDWLLDLLEEVALAKPAKIDPYVAAVGVTIQYEDLIAATGAGLSDHGTVLRGDAVRRLCCDAGIHRVVVRGKSEILDFGRDQRLFDRAMRRAIRFRHGHACAIRGCGRRITHIHHIQFFEHGGDTSVDNGIALCSYHHHLVHNHGWQVGWVPETGLVRFTGPKGQALNVIAEFVPRLVA